MFFRSPVWLVAWLLFLFSGALLLGTRHNNFPYFYHPDEAEKVRQVMTGNWNYHHPMLLLATTRVVATTIEASPQEQAIVEVGRWVSATFVAGAVVALALLAYLWRGWPVAIGTGLALLLHHQLFELAHYFKEDTALLFGVALTFLAVYHYWQKPGLLRAALLGAAVACAISGKYLGVVVLAVVLPVLWLAPGEGRFIRIAGFLSTFLVVTLVVNLPLVLHPGSFRASFDREVEMVVRGQRGTTRSVPHALYWNVFRDNSTPIMWALLAVFFVHSWRRRRRFSLVEWLIIAFPLAYTLLLSCSPKSNDRYFLPASALLTLFAAIGAVDTSRLIMRWVHPRWTVPALLGILVIWQIPDWSRYETAFQHDDNRALFDWVKSQIPPTAVIAKDSRIRLPETDNPQNAERFGPLPQKVIGDKFAADLGTIDELRKQGVTHVAVSESDYGRFFLRSLRPKKDEEAAFARRKLFYEELLREGESLFERERGTVLYLHPGIRLYRLPAD